MEIISQIFNCFHLFACFVLLLNHDTSPEFQKYLSATSSIPLRTMEATLYREEQGVKTEGLGCGRSVSRHSLTLSRTLEHTGLGQPVTQEGCFWRLIISAGDFARQLLTITDDLFDRIQAHFIAKLISTMPQLPPPPKKQTTKHDSGWHTAQLQDQSWVNAVLIFRKRRKLRLGCYSAGRGLASFAQNPGTSYWYSINLLPEARGLDTQFKISLRQVRTHLFFKKK